MEGIRRAIRGALSGDRIARAKCVMEDTAQREAVIKSARKKMNARINAQCMSINDAATRALTRIEGLAWADEIEQVTEEITKDTEFIELCSWMKWKDACDIHIKCEMHRRCPTALQDRWGIENPELEETETELRKLIAWAQWKTEGGRIKQSIQAEQLNATVVVSGLGAVLVCALLMGVEARAAIITIEGVTAGALLAMAGLQTRNGWGNTEFYVIVAVIIIAAVLSGHSHDETMFAIESVGLLGALAAWFTCRRISYGGAWKEAKIFEARKLTGEDPA